MASTTFQDYNQNTPIVSSWLNDVNGLTYNVDTTRNVASQIPVAWVRFNGSTAVISSSSNVTSVLRTGPGQYTVNYSLTLPSATNCYSINTNLAGFDTIASEAVNSVSIVCSNTSNTPTDATIVCVQIFASH